MSESLESKIISECFNPKEEEGEIILYIDFRPDEFLTRIGIRAAREHEKANQNADKIVKGLGIALKEFLRRLEQKGHKFNGKTIIVEDENNDKRINETNKDELFTDILFEYIHYLEDHVENMPNGSKPKNPEKFLMALKERATYALGSIE